MEDPQRELTGPRARGKSHQMGRHPEPSVTARNCPGAHGRWQDGTDHKEFVSWTDDNDDEWLVLLMDQVATLSALAPMAGHLSGGCCSAGDHTGALTVEAP